MTVVRLTFDSEPLGPRFERTGEVILAAAREAAQDVADKGLEAGQEAIIRAPGNFGPRWTRGLSAKVSAASGVVTVSFTHDIPYFWVHQEGATITAKRGLMWIPLIPGTENQTFANTFFATSRAGNPILFQKRGKEIRPLRVGKKSVTIPKRFRVKEEIELVMQQFPEFYGRRLQARQR